MRKFARQRNSLIEVFLLLDEQLSVIVVQTWKAVRRLTKVKVDAKFASTDSR